MERQKLINELVVLLNRFVNENEIDLDKKINLDENTKFLGSSSIFDSIELVQFIVEVESFVNNNLGFKIELTSDKAMSRRNSPFISIDSIANFIIEENE